MLDTDTPVIDATGHRERLRARLFDDPEGLHDHELIEYLLAVALPRIDTKAIAKRLIAEFGSFGRVLAAEPTALRRGKGMGDVSAAAIKIAQAAAIRLARAEARAAPVLSNWQALSDYLQARLAHENVEEFRLLHLDTRNMLVLDEALSRGTIDQTAVHVREVIKRALEVGSAALILVHNHPSGDPSPSRADIDITQTIIAAAKPLGISVHDHIIVGASGQVSLRSKGLL